jgi:diguanylate cyclase (GGDEF)-like protein
MLNVLDQALSAMPRRWFIVLILALVVIIGAFDFLTGFRLSFAIFYFLPIALATWYGGKRFGLTVVVLSFLLSATAGLINARGQLENELIVLWNGVTPLALFLVISALLDKLRTRLQQEQRLARTDYLTGCLNAHAFMPMLQYHFDLAARDGRPITLAYIDLDDFKVVNDTQGHNEGDRVLKLVARIWLESCRHTDLVVRLGGDEFCVLFPNTDQRGAASIIHKARQAMTGAFLTEHVNITCSIGAITFPVAVQDIDEAIKAADLLMYRAKKTHGKNSTVFSVFEPGRNTACAEERIAQARRKSTQKTEQ